jgi:hypothetical protein
MKTKYKNSISNKKVKINLLQHKARSLSEQMTLLCPNIYFTHNHFKTKTIGQFKLFILGFSELISHNQKMSFSK